MRLDFAVEEMGTTSAVQTIQLSLQWGRDQMIAEITSDFEPATTASSLQWGRDQMIAEIRGHGRIRPTGCIASMGPRSDDRGNSVHTSEGSFYKPQLQWGRDQMIAEIAALRLLSREAGLALQWGRDQMIAEIGRRSAVGLDR